MFSNMLVIIVAPTTTYLVVKTEKKARRPILGLQVYNLGKGGSGHLAIESMCAMEVQIKGTCFTSVHQP